LDYKRGIWPVKTNITYPERFSLEQAEEENREGNGCHKQTIKLQMAEGQIY